MVLLTVNTKANTLANGFAALEGDPSTVANDNNTPEFQNPYDLETSVLGRYIREQIEKCKTLAQSVKKIPYSQWLANPNFREAIPPREMSDTFVDLYFKTSESLYRILHVCKGKHIPFSLRLSRSFLPRHYPTFPGTFCIEFC
jgi:hypothetical protein